MAAARRIVCTALEPCTGGATRSIGRDHDLRRLSTALRKSPTRKGLPDMPPFKRLKPTVAGATGELQIIEQFGRPLGIQDIASLNALQSASRHLIITTPHETRPGKSQVNLHGCEHRLLVSRQPLLDTARLLLAIGCRPDAIIARRRLSSTEDDMWAPLYVAAKLTVDETNGTVFAKWKPFSRSAVRRVGASASYPAIGGVPNPKSDGRPDRREPDVDRTPRPRIAAARHRD